MKNKKNTDAPNFENPAEAARAWAAEYEARIAAEKERDKAKTERGQISSGREATALATIMLANREISKLKAVQQATPVLESKRPAIQSQQAKHAINYIAEIDRIGQQQATNSLAIQYATCEQVSKATDWPYEWHPLRQWCNRFKQKPIDLEINGNTVKAWPASAWKAVFGVDILALREDGVLV